MRRALLLFMLPLSMSGCSDNKGKLENTRWVSRKTFMDKKVVPAGALRYEFDAEGFFVYTTPAEVVRGEYALGPASKVTLKYEKPVGGGTDHIARVSIEGDVLSLNDGLTNCKFERVK